MEVWRRLFLVYALKSRFTPGRKCRRYLLNVGCGGGPHSLSEEWELEKITYICVNGTSIVLCLARSTVTIPAKLSQLFYGLSYQTFLYSILSPWYCSQQKRQTSQRKAMGIRFLPIKQESLQLCRYPEIAYSTFR